MTKNTKNPVDLKHVTIIGMYVDPNETEVYDDKEFIGLYHDEPESIISPYFDQEYKEYVYRFKVHVLSLTSSKTNNTDYAINDHISFDFHDSIANCKNNIKTLTHTDLINAFYCYISDALSYDQSNDDLSEFLCEFGYTDDKKSIRAGIKAFEGCKEAYQILSSFLSIDLYDISNIITDCENNDDYSSIIVETDRLTQIP